MQKQDYEQATLPFSHVDQPCYDGPPRLDRQHGEGGSGEVLHWIVCFREGVEEGTIMNSGAGLGRQSVAKS